MQVQVYIAFTVCVYLLLFLSSLPPLLSSILTLLFTYTHSPVCKARLHTSVALSHLPSGSLSALSKHYRQPIPADACLLLQWNWHNFAYNPKSTFVSLSCLFAGVCRAGGKAASLLHIPFLAEVKGQVLPSCHRPLSSGHLFSAVHFFILCLSLMILPHRMSLARAQELPHANGCV